MFWQNSVVKQLKKQKNMKINWYKQWKNLMDTAKNAYLGYLKFRLVGKKVKMRKLNVYRGAAGWLNVEFVVKDIIWDNSDGFGPTFISEDDKAYYCYSQHSVEIVS